MADADIARIARDSLAPWGLARADKYLLGLYEAFEKLAGFPDIGRDASHIRPGYLRMEAASHSVLTESGVLIVRVLHHRMDFERHL